MPRVALLPMSAVRTRRRYGLTVIAHQSPGPANLTGLQRFAGPRPPWLASLVQPEIGGGKLSPSQLAELSVAMKKSPLVARTESPVLASL
jgi:hypothetical protein